MSDIADIARLYLKLFDRELIALLLTLPRLYAFLSTSQIFATSAVPRTSRTAAILSLSIIAVPINLVHVDSFERTVPAFALYIIKEYLIGFILGYIVGWVFWAVQSAGAFIDNQRGAAVAASIDPLQGIETSPIGMMFSQAFLTYIFTTGAILPIIGLVYQSFVLWPATLGVPILSDAFPALVLNVADNALRIVVVIAGPIVALMFVAEFALAMVSRFAPQVQVFVLAMPIKSGLAIFILIFYFSRLLPFAEGQLSTLDPYMRQFLNVMRFSPGGSAPVPPIIAPPAETVPSGPRPTNATPEPIP